VRGQAPRHVEPVGTGARRPRLRVDPAAVAARAIPLVLRPGRNSKQPQQGKQPENSEAAHGIESSTPCAAVLPTYLLVAVVVGLVGTLDVDADVLGLVLAQLGEPDAEGVEVQPRDLLVQVLREDVDLALVLVVLR